MPDALLTEFAFGIIDLAGFKKDRFYLYQSRWRPELPLVHILPHWNWPERVGKVTPVHVLTSGDAAELFLNGRSLGRKKKGPHDYRLRWDDVTYQPGELKVVAYKDGETWATNVVRTTDEPFGLEAVPDRSVIRADGKDLSFVTIQVVDERSPLMKVFSADDEMSASAQPVPRAAQSSRASVHLRLFVYTA